jgi:hypothetical protein
MTFAPGVRLDFDSVVTPCNDVLMPDWELKMRFLGSAPNTTNCDAVDSRTTGEVGQVSNDRRQRTPKEKG